MQWQLLEASAINKCSHSSFIYTWPIYFISSFRRLSSLTNPPTGKKILRGANRAYDEFGLRVSEFILKIHLSNVCRHLR